MSVGGYAARKAARRGTKHSDAKYVVVFTVKWLRPLVLFSRTTASCCLSNASANKGWTALEARLGTIPRGARRNRATPRYSSRYLSWRSEEHTSELQSLMRISYAVFCLKKKKI